jgi:hypothetical protein
MSMKHPAIASLLAGAALVLTACGTGATADAPPARIVPVAGSQIPRLQLTSGAVQRLGIATQPVRTAAAAPARTGVREVIPYSAVVYDTDGSTWTYVNTAVRTYRREPITVNAVSGEVALLSAGPPVGARVVTVGSAELLGTEYNISGEE